MAFISVCKVGDIPEGQGQAFNVGGTTVAVFNTPDGYHAISDFCPHQGASLATGHCDDGVVYCPWHAWGFQLSDGAWLDNPRVKVDRFEVKAENGEILVSVPERDS